jgi:N-acetylgalactosamine-6-sulfatase
MMFDLTATILQASRATLPDDSQLDGIDLLPTMRGGGKPFPRTVFWRSKRGTRFRKAVRDGDLKYVWDDGHEELHNLAGDPREEEDLLAQMPEAAEQLQAKLAEWERDVMAPRLRPFKSSPG